MRPLDPHLDMRLTKLLRGLDGFADDKWVCASAEFQHRMLARLRGRPTGRSRGLVGAQSAAATAQGIPVIGGLGQEMRGAGCAGAHGSHGARCARRKWGRLGVRNRPVACCHLSSDCHRA